MGAVTKREGGEEGGPILKGTEKEVTMIQNKLGSPERKPKKRERREKKGLEAGGKGK